MPPMSQESSIVIIPQIKFLAGKADGMFNHRFWDSYPRVQLPVKKEINDTCYGVLVENEDYLPILRLQDTGVFCPMNSLEAIEKVYTIGFRDDSIKILKILNIQANKNQIAKKSNSKGAGGRLYSTRKSFLTPTPLHIPGSRVKPLKEPENDNFMVKGLNRDSKLEWVSKSEVLWFHPLVHIERKL